MRPSSKPKVVGVIYRPPSGDISEFNKELDKILNNLPADKQASIVMGDFITIGIMGGQQIASVGKIINVQMNYLQFPAAAANAVILIMTTLLIIWVMTKMIDIRKEL